MQPVCPVELSEINNSQLLAAALHYASLGIPVFPVTPGAKAPPLVPFSRVATTLPDQIEAWWTQWPEANIGLAMGGEWATLDLDRHGTEDGWASYVEAGGPAPPPWPVQHTPSGGIHLLWRVGEELGGSLSNFTRRGSSGGMDLRTRNGYILAAPSVVGGRGYAWASGARDPGANIPTKLWSFCTEASSRAAERSLEAFPMPEAREVGEDEVAEAVARLGHSFERFLLHGEAITDDRSNDAYRACLRAFSVGWTLEDMATWGPWTFLGELGREHNAKDPWAWMWKYTVRSAWQDWGAKESPEPGGDGAEDLHTLREGTIAVENESSPGGVNRQALDAGLYREFEFRAGELPPGDFGAAHAYLRDLWASGLPRSAQLALMAVVKDTARWPLTVLREAMREIEESGGKRPTQKAAEVYVRSQGKLYDPRSGQLITKDAFLTMRAREHGGDRGQAEQAWLQDAGALCDEVETLTYDPALPTGVVSLRAGTRAYNTYLPSLLRPTPGDVAPWMNLLDALDWEDPGAKDWLLDRFAWWVQRPGQKINHGVLLGGAKGIGKDSLLAPVIEAVGESNTTIIDGAELLSEFNSFLVQAKLVVVNEVDFGTHAERRQVSEKLKRILAAPPQTLRVNEKGLKRYDIPNRVQVVGQTNHRLCLHADADERRWLMLWAGRVHRGDEEKAEWARWFEGYWGWLERGGAEHVYEFLLRRDVSALSPGSRPPETEWQREISGASLTGLEMWITERISEGEGEWGLPLIGAAEILKAVRSHEAMAYLGDKGREVRVQDIARALANLGVRRKRVGLRRSRMWVIHPEMDYEGAVEDVEATGVVLRAEDRFQARRDAEWVKRVARGDIADVPDWF